MKIATVLFGIVFMGVATSPVMAGKMHAKGTICASNGCSSAGECKPHSGVAHVEKSANTGFGDVKVVAHEQAGNNYVTLSVPPLAAANGWSASGHAHHHGSNFCVGPLAVAEHSNHVFLSDRPPVPGTRGTSQYIKQTWLPNAAGDKINVAWTPDSFLQVDPSELSPGNRLVSRASLTGSGLLAGTVELSARLDERRKPQIDTRLTGIFKGMKFKLVTHPGGVVSLKFKQPLTWTVPGNEETFDIALNTSIDIRREK